MKISELSAISPVDGRYRNKVSELSLYFSEQALINHRLWVEVEYFLSLCDIPLPALKDFNKEDYAKLRALYLDNDEKSALRIKEIEAVTNHDVKAVEYFMKEEFDRLGWEKYKEYIHFGLTSQDINNTAVPLSIKRAVGEYVRPLVTKVYEKLVELALQWKEVPMLARTHGQPASPTTMGKEIMVFAERLKNQLSILQSIPVSAKFGGATGNFNAHKVAFSEIDWKKFADVFVQEKLGLKRQMNTTQIEHYDDLAALFNAFARINTILIDLSRDIWMYVSLGYFKQQIKKGEVGSSAMPHKVNPIDFENAEGNFGVANALFHHFAEKLPVSRLQRDLTDSTVLRNVGVPFSHSAVSYLAILKGLSKLTLDENIIRKDLDDNWSVVAEAIQTVLRREGVPNPYEQLKELTRKNEKVTRESIHAFIDGLEVSDALKNELREITPYNYTGYPFTDISG